MPATPQKFLNHMVVAPGGYVVSFTTAIPAIGDLPGIPGNTVLGNIIGPDGSATPLTAGMITPLLNIFTATTPGAAPPSGGDPQDFLRADATWQAVLLAVGLFTAIKAGLAPASGGGIQNFLCADGSWRSPNSSLLAFPMPPAPTVLTAGSPTASSVTLTYTIDAKADGIAVWYRVTGSSPWAPFFIGPASGTITVTGLLPNTAYSFALAATNGGGQNGPWKEVSATTSAGTVNGTLFPWDVVQSAERPRSRQAPIGHIDQLPAVFQLPPTRAPNLGWPVIATTEKPKSAKADPGTIDNPLLNPPLPPPAVHGWDVNSADRPKPTKADPGTIDSPLVKPPIPPAPGRGFETITGERSKSTQAPPGNVDSPLFIKPLVPPGRGWEHNAAADKPKSTKADPGHIDSPLFKAPPAGCANGAACNLCSTTPLHMLVTIAGYTGAEAFLNGTYTVPQTSTGTYSCFWSSNNTPASGYTLSVEVFDSGGVSSTMPPIEVQVLIQQGITADAFWTKSYAVTINAINCNAVGALALGHNGFSADTPTCTVSCI